MWIKNIIYYIYDVLVDVPGDTSTEDDKVAEDEVGTDHDAIHATPAPPSLTQYPALDETGCIITNLPD